MMLSPDEAERIERGLVIPLFKPPGWSSFQAVKKVKGIVFRALDKRIKIGHAGTLDPLAEGLLLICTGRATKQINELQDLTKEYTGRFRLGATTPSFDLETEVDETYPVEHINHELLQKAASELTGPQMQVPPLYSARWIEGKRAYTFARQGLKPAIDSRPVIIEQFEILSAEIPVVSFRILCSKGTYIRSLARDFGVKCGSGAYLEYLCRTAIGPFHTGKSYRADQLEITDILQCEEWPRPNH